MRIGNWTKSAIPINTKLKNEIYLFLKINNKINMRQIIIFSLLVLIYFSNSQPTKEQIMEALNRNKRESKQGSKIPNLLVFTFKKERINDIPMFARILQEFLSTVGITANFGEPQENEIIATIERGKTVDKKMIMDNFKDVLENVEIADFTKG